MKIPKEIDIIIADAAVRIPVAQDAIKSAYAKCLRYPQVKAAWKAFLLKYVEQGVWDGRHEANRLLKKETFEHPKQKVFIISSAGCRRVERTWLNFSVGGKTLGDVRGDELHDIGLEEMKKSREHKFNAQLVFALEKIVPSSKKVRQVLSEKKLRNLALRIQRDLDEEEAA